jgi:hypothetical protein
MTDIVQDYAGVGSLLTYPGHNVRFPVCTFTTALSGGLVPPALQVVVAAPGDESKTPLAHITVIIDAVRSPADPLYDTSKNVFRVWLQVERTLLCSPVFAVDIALYAYNGAAYQALGDTFVLSKELKFTGPVTDYLGNTVNAGVVEGVEGQYELKFYPEVDEADEDGYIKVGSMYVFGGKPNSDVTPYTVAVLEDDAAGNIAEGVKIDQLPVEGAADTTLLNIYYKPAAAAVGDFSRDNSESSQVYITVRDQALRTICRQFSLLPVQQPSIVFDYVNSGYADVDGVPGFLKSNFAGLIGTFSVADAVDRSAFFSLTPGANASEFSISGGALSVIGDRVVSTNDERQDIVAGTVQFTENGRTFAFGIDKHYYIFDAMNATAVDAITSNSVDFDAYDITSVYYPDHDTVTDGYISILDVTINDTVDVENIAVQLYDDDTTLQFTGTDLRYTKVGSTVQFQILASVIPKFRLIWGGKPYGVMIYDSKFQSAPETTASVLLPGRILMRSFTFMAFFNPIIKLTPVATPDSHSAFPDNYPGYLWSGEGAINLSTLSLENSTLAGVTNVFSFADGSSSGPYDILSDNVLAIEGFDTTDVITLGANTLQVSENGRQFPYTSDINVYAYEQLAVGLVENLTLASGATEITQDEDGKYVVYYYPSVDNRDGNLFLGSVTTTSNYGVLDADISAPFDVVVNDGVAYFTTPYSPGDLNADTAALSTGTRDGSYAKDNLVFTLYDSRFQFDASISNGRTVSVIFKLYPIAAPVVNFTWREPDETDDEGIRGYLNRSIEESPLGTLNVATTSGNLPVYDLSVGMVDGEKYVINEDVYVYVRPDTYTPSSVEPKSLAVLTVFGETKSFVVNENDRVFYSDPADGTQYYVFNTLVVHRASQTVRTVESNLAALSHPLTLQYGLGTYTLTTTITPNLLEDTSNPHAANVVRNVDTESLVTIPTYAASETAVEVQATNFILTEELGTPAGDKPTQWAQFRHSITATRNSSIREGHYDIQVWNNLQKAAHDGKTPEGEDTTFTVDDGDKFNINYGENHTIPFAFFVKGGIRVPTPSGVYNASISISPSVLAVDDSNLDLQYLGAVSAPVTYAVEITATVGDESITFGGGGTPILVHFYTPMLLSLPTELLQFVKIVDNSSPHYLNTGDKVYKVVQDGVDVYTVGTDSTYGPYATAITYIAGHPSTEFDDAPTVTLKKLAFGASGDADVSLDATLEWIAGSDPNFSSRQIRVTDVDLDPFARYSVEVSSSSAHDPTEEWVVSSVIGEFPSKGVVTSLSSNSSTVLNFEIVSPTLDILPVDGAFDPAKTMVNFAPNSDTIDYSPKALGSDGNVTVYSGLAYNAFKVLLHNPDGLFTLNNFKHSVRIGFVRDFELSGLTYENLPDRATHKLMFVNGPANETYNGYIDVNVVGRNTYQVTGSAPLTSIVAIVSTCNAIGFGKYKLVVLSQSGSDLTIAANGSIYDHTVLNNDSIGFVFNTILWTTANVHSASLERQEDLSQQWPDHLLLQFTGLRLHEVDENETHSYPYVDSADPSPVFSYELQAKQESESSYATLVSGSAVTYAVIQEAIAELVLPERKLTLTEEDDGQLASWISTNLWLNYRVRIENDALGQALQVAGEFDVSSIRSQVYTKGQFTDFRVPGSRVTVRETLRDDASLFETIRVKSEVFPNDGISTYVFNTFPVTNPAAAVQTQVVTLQSTVSTNATNLIAMAALNAAASAAAAEADYEAAEAALATVRFAAPAALENLVSAANANLTAASNAAVVAQSNLNNKNIAVSNAETVSANAQTAVTDANATRDSAIASWSTYIANDVSAEVIEAARVVKEAAELAATNAATSAATALANLNTARLDATSAASAATAANDEATRLLEVRNNATAARDQVTEYIAAAVASVTTALNNSTSAAENATTARNATTTTAAVEAAQNAASLANFIVLGRASVEGVVLTIKNVAGL